jgi:minor extracellular serine protease Vpr
LRRATSLLAALVALSAASSAAAHLRVRHGTIPTTTTRVRVVVSLGLPPLALRGRRGLAVAVARRKLDTTSASARAYVRKLERAQARATAALRAAIPQARVGRRFQVVLDALTVSLPAAKLPTLLRQHWAAHVYPSVAYRLATDRSPSVIGADVLHQTTGAEGTGEKIAVVDDGIDQTNAFFNPAGFSYPSGFPKGITTATTPKVIVARVFPGPNAGTSGRLPVDPETSFHGTHVAGIAAGDSGTTAPAGADHPRTTGLSGVAPQAWLGNYRVFTVPTPLGRVADTPEIVAAFEAAVKDGMDVINFSGGGPEVEPSNDALVAAVHAVAAAGVVPVIAAGNDRDDFGVGSVGSPGSAPDAISVAAVSDTHVFGAHLTVPADPSLDIPYVGANGEPPPRAWRTTDETLVDVGSLGVDRHLCGRPDALDVAPRLPGGSLRGAIALVERGLCPFTTKADAARAAGAIGIVFVDNREGEANSIPTQLALPGGMIANLDGERLLALMHSGRLVVRVDRGPFETETGRSGVITSFSSAGPTAFHHLLKPDISAPGGQILSATLRSTDASRFAVFDGTSMATPHVAGSAALLLQLHPSWTVAEVKSALMSTAAPAWGDTARMHEAAVPLEGAGLVALPSANDPRLFTDPASLSFTDVLPGVPKSLVLHIADAGNGAGTWTIGISAQSATPGASIECPPVAVVAPGGATDVVVSVHAPPDAPSGEDYGFLMLTQGSVVRRVPYFFLVDRSALAAYVPKALRILQQGDTRRGTSRVTTYRYPAAPFGNQPDEPSMTEDGSEIAYGTTLPGKAVNAGVVVLDESSGARVDPWYLGALDENDVQGFTGTPVDVNELTYDYKQDVGAAGVEFPAAGTYYVVVDSGRGQFDNRRLAGRYTLRSWVNDVTPPTLQLLTTRVTAGRPTLVFRTTDTQSGVDPSSLTIGYRGNLVGTDIYRRPSGLAIFVLPESVPALRSGRVRLRMISSDYQETKNVDTEGPQIMPNTRTRTVTLHVVSGVTVNWLLGTCRQLEVTAGAPRRVSAVRFSVAGHVVATAHHGVHGVWSAAARLSRGTHAVIATAVDSAGRTAVATRMVIACGG